MKTRSGFVSNSSSSSFVVAFPRQPQSKDEVKEMLFGEEKSLEYYDTVLTADEVSSAVWDEILSMKDGPPSLDDIAEEFQHGELVESRVPYPDFGATEHMNVRERRAMYKRYEHERLEEAKKVASDFVDSNKGCVFFVFEYSDNDGSFWSAMEHGDVFNRLPHERISHH